MTKKKSLLSLAIIVCSIVFLLSAFTAFGGGLFGRLFGKSEEKFIEEYYDYGETFTVPTHSVADGVETASVVTYPDGTQTGKKEIVLNQAGLYTVEYSAVKEGKLFQEDYSFKVKYPTVTGGANSKIYYGVSPYGDAADTPGLVVELDSSDTIEFSQIIDLRGSKKDTPFVEFFPAPSSMSSDCEQFWVTLTDVEDPECFIQIRMNLYTEGSRQTMTLAGRSNSQAQVIGLEASKGIIHVGDQYGSYPGVEMNGMTHGIYERNGEINALKLIYEESTKTLWSGCKWPGMTYKIVDLDDPKFVGDSLWNGFTSGKVRMSFYARGYMAEKANFVFKNIKGGDFEAGAIEDTIAPTIIVDEIANVPAVGGEFPVPAYSVIDDFSPVVKKAVSVFKSGMPVLVKNGAFKTETAGTYSIVYTAYDSFGNKAEKTIYVVAEGSGTLALSEDSLQQSYNRGEKVVLPSASLTGGRGESVVNIYATKDGETELLEKGAFIPMEEGEYTLTYEGVDAVGQKVTKTHTVTVVNGANPVFRDEPVLPSCFISSFNYRDPILYAYDYSSGSEKKVPATLTMKDGDGSHAVEFGGGFTPIVNGNFEEVTLTWKAGNTTLERKVKTVFALSSEGVLLENYFLGTTGVEKGDGYMEFSATAEDSSWTFLNSLIADSFSLDFVATPAYSDFDAIEIVLTDAENADVAFTVRLTPAANYRSVVTIGRRAALLSSGFNKYSTSNKYAMSYSEGVFSIGSAHLIVDKTDRGEDFDGFPSETVNLSVRFVGAEIGARYRISNLCGQPLGELFSDRIKPLVKILGNYGGTSVVGGMVNIPQMIARDVLNPNVITYVTVKDTNGNFVKAIDGTVLNKAPTNRDYSFKTMAYGQYQCEYVAVDTLSGRDNKIPFVITVFDSEAPVISFATDPVESVKVGEVIVVPNIVMEDNVTAEENLIVSRYIVSATGRIFHLAEGSNSMRTAYVGTYQIRVIVYVEAGNIAMLRYDVTVTE